MKIASAFAFIFVLSLACCVQAIPLAKVRADVALTDAPAKHQPTVLIVVRDTAATSTTSPLRPSLGAHLTAATPSGHKDDDPPDPAAVPTSLSVAFLAPLFLATGSGRAAASPTTPQTQVPHTSAGAVVLAVTDPNVSDTTPERGPTTGITGERPHDKDASTLIRTVGCTLGLLVGVLIFLYFLFTSSHLLGFINPAFRHRQKRSASARQTEMTQRGSLGSGPTRPPQAAHNVARDGGEPKISEAAPPYKPDSLQGELLDYTLRPGIDTPPPTYQPSGRAQA